MNGLTLGHRRALSVALGLSDGPTAEQLTVNTAALGLAERAARDPPLSCSSTTCRGWTALSALVIARRLREWRIGLIVSARSNTKRFSPPGTFPNSS
jgi:hypothetical protein